jgi:hypothetical protein
MMTQLLTVESATLPQAEPDPCQKEYAIEKHAACEPDLPATAEQVTRQEVVALRGGAARSLGGGLPIDLVREGANMLELQMRQSRCITPLSISSKATQALLRQF